MRILKAKCGLEVIVDDDDYHELAKHEWSITDRGYVHRLEVIDGELKTIRMHRHIMGCKNKDGQQVDHANGIKHDNRKENLRLCNAFKNMTNRVEMKNNTSGLKGVHYCKRKKRWIARISIDGKRKTIGRYKDKMEAFFDYCVIAISIHGEYSNLGGRND